LFTLLLHSYSCTWERRCEYFMRTVCSLTSENHSHAADYGSLVGISHSPHASWWAVIGIRVQWLLWWYVEVHRGATVIHYRIFFARFDSRTYRPYSRHQNGKIQSHIHEFILFLPLQIGETTSIFVYSLICIGYVHFRCDKVSASPLQ
jgi:hypothetical protein